MRTIPTRTTAKAPQVAPASAPVATAPASPEPSAGTIDLAEDPVLAQATYAIWAGKPVVAVASPPGAGKTRLITRLAAVLHQRGGFRVAVAGQRRHQCLDIANRIAELGCPVGYRGRSTAKARPYGLHPNASYFTTGATHRFGVMVTTTASWSTIPAHLASFDVMLIDEAYQATMADAAMLAAFAPQMLTVGDPGQIEPLVTGSTRRWAHDPAGPHVPAPRALSALYGDEVVALHLPQTWRLGPATTALIAPAFYAGLPFTSARPPIHLSTPTGDQLPELTAQTLTPLSDADYTIAAAAAHRVEELLTCRVHTDDGERAITPADIAVVVPHRHQTSAISALLAHYAPHLAVDTIDALQGAERIATVVIHPMLGAAELSEFHFSPGRTCVALSRHRAHTTVLVDSRTPALLRAEAQADPSNTWATVHADLLRGLDDH